MPPISTYSGTKPGINKLSRISSLYYQLLTAMKHLMLFLLIATLLGGCSRQAKLDSEWLFTVNTDRGVDLVRVDQDFRSTSFLSSKSLKNTIVYSFDRGNVVLTFGENVVEIASDINVRVLIKHTGKYHELKPGAKDELKYKAEPVPDAEG